MFLTKQNICTIIEENKNECSREEGRTVMEQSVTKDTIIKNLLSRNETAMYVSIVYHTDMAQISMRGIIHEITALSNKMVFEMFDNGIEEEISLCINDDCIYNYDGHNVFSIALATSEKIEIEFF